jgi:hypothetical protein
MLPQFVLLERMLESFINRGAGHWLLLEASDSEALLLAKLLLDFDRQRGAAGAASGPPILLLLFSHEFRHPEQYVDDLLAQLRLQHQLLDATLKLANQPPLPPLPAALRQTKRPPAERLRAAMAALTPQLLLDPDLLLLWGICPLRVTAPAAYVQLFAELAPTLELPPRSSALVRELPNHPHHFAMRSQPRLDRQPSQLGSAALIASLELALASPPPQSNQPRPV